ncbi:dTDP-4-dehydrorhamnose reductase [Hahella chejuensis KCTC 2396]|uniref:dTDP-4-dehydrorhamnose reductase n=1 Tax=Hahella chejuensis (strain KCTC 2396) TaxID=349521 RepID=Q2SJF4_HAHCH|nr:dTDP-4-dehydrorhamnose reductase [Hahella chejuensis]ABC29220.1 dTDP-4-dehydrorhamnose reductase [Hahella chejuensis KCTC 2396]
MEIMVTGATGQLGWELARSLSMLGRVRALGRNQCDLNDPGSLRAVVRDIKPDVIVNAAAYTAVDKAESDRGGAMRVNSDSVAVLAEEAKNCGALFVHYSTDYVFNGEKGAPYVEVDPVCPINTYGYSKLSGENLIRQVDGNYLIFRTSWVYASRGKNFLLTMLNLAQTKEVLSVVSDQRGAPTWARDLAQMTLLSVYKSIHAIHNNSFKSGIYNLASSGETSWHGFASYLIEEFKSQSGGGAGQVLVKDINKVTSDFYKTDATRPAYSKLDATKFEDEFQVFMPDWKDSCRLCIADIIAGLTR